jgi:hypothetical protein
VCATEPSTPQIHWQENRQFTQKCLAASLFDLLVQLLYLQEKMHQSLYAHLLSTLVYNAKDYWVLTLGHFQFYYLTFPHSFLIAPAKKEEEKATAEATVAVKEPGFLSQYGLDDFKITGPIGLALTIPAISNGVCDLLYLLS